MSGSSKPLRCWPTVTPSPVLTPLTPDTRHLIDAARGGVVDESALIAALCAGRIGAAALNVFENEPHVNPALLDTPNRLLAVDNVAAVLAGRPALTSVR